MWITPSTAIIKILNTPLETKWDNFPFKMYNNMLTKLIVDTDTSGTYNIPSVLPLNLFTIKCLCIFSKIMIFDVYVHGWYTALSKR